MKSLIYFLTLSSVLFFSSCGTTKLVPNTIFNEDFIKNLKIEKKLESIQFFSDTTQELILKPILTFDYLSVEIKKDGGVLVDQKPLVDIIIPKQTEGKLKNAIFDKKGNLERLQIYFDNPNKKENNFLTFGPDQNNNFILFTNADGTVDFEGKKYVPEGGDYLYFFSVLIDGQNGQRKLSGAKIK